MVGTMEKDVGMLQKYCGIVPTLFDDSTLFFLHLITTTCLLYNLPGHTIDLKSMR